MLTRPAVSILRPRPGRPKPTPRSIVINWCDNHCNSCSNWLQSSTVSYIQYMQSLQQLCKCEPIPTKEIIHMNIHDVALQQQISTSTAMATVSATTDTTDWLLYQAVIAILTTTASHQWSGNNESVLPRASSACSNSDTLKWPLSSASTVRNACYQTPSQHITDNT